MHVAPPTIGHTYHVLSGIDLIGQPRIRTAPGPRPGFSTFRSTPGGGYRRMGGGGRGGFRRHYPYYPYYGYYGGYGGYPYYGGYGSSTYSGGGYITPPATPQEIYSSPISAEDKQRYCKNVYGPFCQRYPQQGYCRQYKDFCETFPAPPPVQQ